MLSLNITHHDGIARSGTVTTAHGTFDTPAFMTVGTLGAPKGVTPGMVVEHGGQVLLMNAFHLAWRPGEKLVQQLGGVNGFTGWKGPVLTDSGGFQIFSLPGLRKITDAGALFASAIDGAQRLFSPEAVVEISCALAPDMAMVLDECPPYPCEPAVLTSAVDRSIRWAERSIKHVEKVRQDPSYYPGNRNPQDVEFFGIIQGGFKDSERQRSLVVTAALPFAGLALGGFCVGETIEDTHHGITYTAPRMPADRPRYLMGMGTPTDILLAVAHGVDMFDCTLPTRGGRNGMAFTSRGVLHIKNARHAQDNAPLDPDCQCYTCRNYSRAFLRHLLLAREINAAILTSLHNLAFYFHLMHGIREAIKTKTLAAFTAAFMAKWNAGDAV